MQQVFVATLRTEEYGLEVLVWQLQRQPYEKVSAHSCASDGGSNMCCCGVDLAVVGI
jgi:hypothetical protein